MNILSRKNEFEADEYAKKTYDGESLSLALKKLSSLSGLTNLHLHFMFFISLLPSTIARKIKSS